MPWSAATAPTCSSHLGAQRVERVAWVALALGVAAWAAGEIYYSVALAHLGNAPYPSVSDALFVAFYPLTFLGLFLLITDRPYRPAIGVDEALEELERCAGTQFDPAVVDACRRMLTADRAATFAETRG